MCLRKSAMVLTMVQIFKPFLPGSIPEATVSRPVRTMSTGGPALQPYLINILVAVLSGIRAILRVRSKSEGKGKVDRSEQCATFAKDQGDRQRCAWSCRIPK